VKEPNAPSNNPAVRTTPSNRKPKVRQREEVFKVLNFNQYPEQYPSALKKLFTTNFTPANPTSLLDYPGAEILIIPSTHSVEQKIGEQVAEKELNIPKKEDEAAESEGMEAARTALEGLGLLGFATPTMEGHWA
jgi:hypothetical protein